MTYPLSELVDRYSILYLKTKRLPEEQSIREEYEKFKNAIREFNVKCDDYIQRMIDVNAQIWDLEFAIRQGRDLPLAEVGRRALLIRDINKKRISIKNEIAKKYGEFEEIKVDHPST